MGTAASPRVAGTLWAVAWQPEVGTIRGSTQAAFSLETQKEAGLPVGPDLGRGGWV